MILKEASATVFTNKRGQFIRLPAELRLPDSVKRVDVRARGCERIIAPLGQTWDSFFLDGTPAPEDFLPERASQPEFGCTDKQQLANGDFRSETPASQPKAEKSTP